MTNNTQDETQAALNGARCAHLTVAYKTRENADCTVSGYWACSGCNTRFEPHTALEQSAAKDYAHAELRKDNDLMLKINADFIERIKARDAAIRDLVGALGSIILCR